MNILIIEDEPVVAKRIKRLVQLILQEKVKHLEISHTVEDAQRYLEKKQPDLIFLDLNLSGESGFDILSGSVQNIPSIIISALHESAIQAFEFGVIDFVRKPISQERLELAIHRYLRSAKKGITQTLPYKYGSKTENIDINSISYIKASGQYSRIFLNDNSAILYSKSLEKMQGMLPESFFRLHRSFIVNLKFIRSLHTSEGSRYQAELINGETLPIGRTFYRKLRLRLFKDNR